MLQIIIYDTNLVSTIILSAGKQYAKEMILGMGTGLKYKTHTPTHIIRLLLIMDRLRLGSVESICNVRI